MPAQNSLISTVLCHYRFRVVLAEPVHHKPLPVTVQLIGLILGGLTLSLLVGVAMASLGPRPVIFEPGQQFLPGNPRPGDVDCNSLADGYSGAYASYTTCSAVQDDKHLSLQIDIASGVIMRAYFLAGEYSIGDLMLVWGAPSGFSRFGRNTYLYWGTREAFVLGCSFSPASNVHRITYERKPIALISWRGFVNIGRTGC